MGFGGVGSKPTLTKVLRKLQSGCDTNQIDTFAWRHGSSPDNGIMPRDAVVDTSRSSELTCGTKGFATMWDRNPLCQ